MWLEGVARSLQGGVAGDSGGGLQSGEHVSLHRGVVRGCGQELARVCGWGLLVWGVVRGCGLGLLAWGFGWETPAACVGVWLEGVACCRGCSYQENEADSCINIWGCGRILGAGPKGKSCHGDVLLP